MALDYHFEAASGILVREGEGDVGLEERQAVTARILEDPALPPRFPILVDATYITNLPTATEIEKISGLVRRLAERGGRRLAIVNSNVGGIVASFLVSRRTDLEPSGVRTFFDRGEAEAWLRS